MGLVPNVRKKRETFPVLIEEFGYPSSEDLTGLPIVQNTQRKAHATNMSISTCETCTISF